MPDENTVRAQRRPESFVIELSYDDAERLHDAIEYIAERTIGFTPPVLTQIEAALWDADDRPVRLLPAMPDDLATLERLSDPADDDWTPTPAEEAAIAAFEAQDDSTVSRARDADYDRYAAFMEAQKPRERAALIAWLDDYARRYTSDLAQWRLRRRDQLHADFQTGEEG